MAAEQFEPESDYTPVQPHDGMEPPTDIRIANAAEYAAYQLGQIKVQLRRIADALEKDG